jgi:hypothetical protein
MTPAIARKNSQLLPARSFCDIEINLPDLANGRCVVASPTEAFALQFVRIFTGGLSQFGFLTVLGLRSKRISITRSRN